MDYVSNNLIIANESMVVKTGVILAYGMKFVAEKKKKEGSKNNA